MEQTSLQQHLEERIRAGASKESIKEQLLAVGWAEDEIEQAYTDALIATGVPVPVDGTRGTYTKRTSTLEIVVNFFSFILLGIVATALGTLLAIAWPVGILACATWLLVAFLFRYSSLAALVSILLAPVYAYAFSEMPVAGTYLADPQRVQLTLFIAVLVVLRHHTNIRRLLTGTEPRIGQRKTPPHK